MTTFTPVASLLGGLLIGLSAVLLMAAQGRIAGISGIVSRLLPPAERSGFAGGLAFVAGLVAAPLIVVAVTGTALTIGRFGLDGIGYSYLVIEVVTTAILVGPAWRMIRRLT